MPTYTLTLTQDEADTLEKVIPDVQEWLENALQGKLNAVLHRLTLEHTQYNPTKVDKATQISAIKQLKLKSRKERDAEELEQMRQRVKQGGDTK